MTEVLKVTITGADDDTIIFEGLPRDAYELLGKYIGKEPTKKWSTKKMAFPTYSDTLTMEMLQQAYNTLNAQNTVTITGIGTAGSF